MGTRARLIRKLGLRPLVLSAGMPRSASTLLFNVLRLCLSEKYGEHLSCGWIGDINNLPTAEIYLLKTHTLGRFLWCRGQYVFYTYRDIREVLVSSSIKFDVTPSLDRCKVLIDEYVKAKKHADLMIKYEDMVNNTEDQISQIAAIIELDVEPRKIFDDLPAFGPERIRSSGYDRVTLTHGKHGSGMREGEWRTALPDNLRAEIQERYAWWFEDAHYNLE